MYVCKIGSPIKLGYTNNAKTEISTFLMSMFIGPADVVAVWLKMSEFEQFGRLTNLTLLRSATSIHTGDKLNKTSTVLFLKIVSSLLNISP